MFDSRRTAHQGRERKARGHEIWVRLDEIDGVKRADWIGDPNHFGIMDEKRAIEKAAARLG
jgi:hypothetical protein